MGFGGPRNWMQLAKAHTSASGTNVIEFLPAGGEFIETGNTDLIVLKTRRTAKTGTCTMDAAIQWYDPTLGTWHTMIDYAGNNVGVVQYANADTLDTTGYRLLTVQLYPIHVDADGVLAYGPTSFYKAVQSWIPEYIRVAVTNGGTTVTNTYDASLFLHHR